MERYRYDDKNQTRLGTIGWLAVGATVLAAEVCLEESLTHAFGRGLDSSRYRPLVLGAMAVTNLHLLRLLPHNLDPIYAIEKVGKLGLEVYRHVK